MKSRILSRTILCLSLLAIPAGAAAAPIVVTFDDLVGQTFVPSPYGGIVWNNEWTYYSFPQPPYTPQSSPVRIYSTGALAGFTFVNPDQIFNGAWFSGPGTTTVQFNLYNDSLLVGTSSILATSSTPTFLASGYGGAVDRVEVLTNGPQLYVMDDVTYDDSSVTAPEPASILLLGTGLLGAGVRRWRQKRT